MPKRPSEPFDPCRAWLGIDRADLADPHLVLGLAADEQDPLRVLRAAEARLARLKGLAAGEHHAAREALILRVEQAREAFLSRIARTSARPATSTFSMPPPPRQAHDRSADAHVEFAEAEDAEPGPETPIVRLRTARPVRRRSSAGAWVTLLAMIGCLATVGTFVWWQGQRGAQRQAARAEARAAEAEREAREAIAEERPRGTRDPSGRPGKPLPEDALVSTSPPPSRDQRPSRPAPDRPDTRPPPAMAMSEGISADTATADEPDMADARSGPQEPDRVAAMTDMADDPAATMEPEESAETPAGDSPSEDGMSAGDAGEVDDAVAEALTAIRAGDFDTADAVLASALESAEALAAKRRVADWQVLAQYARDFAGYREKAIAEVRAGNEFDVNGKVVAVVEIDEKKFIYRWQGRNRTSPRDKIPAGIAYAIVSRWFDARPANQLFLGAWHAVKPEPDAAQARECWERAEKAGLSAEPLLRLLDDPALAGAGGGGDDDADR